MKSRWICWSRHPSVHDRLGNSWFDRIADAYRKPTRAAQRESLHKLDEELRKLRTTVENTASLDKSMHGDPAAALSERVGQILLIMLSPPATLEADLADRATMTFELNKLTFALAAYRANHGSYPAKLADLSPKYVREVPHDIFNDAQPHYRQEGKGYLLYSVGSNGEDDGGKGFENGRRAGESVENDDLVVRMPAPTGPTKKAD